MRVLFSTTAGTGHFTPMLPVARACAAAGHEVAVAAPAGFAAHVVGAGLPHLPFPDVPEELMGPAQARLPTVSRDEANRIVIGEIFGRLDAQASLPTLLELMTSWRPDVVVRDPCEFGAMVAAGRSGVPQAQVAIGLGDFLGSVTHWIDEPLRELEAMAGLDDVLGAERHLATPALSPVPDVLDDGADDQATAERRVWRFRTDPSTTGPALPGSWGDPELPLVYVTFGSVAGSLGPFAAVYRSVVGLLADAPIRVLLTTGTGFDPAGLGPLPANTWATQWWPQEAAMREATAMIGHGGFGTTMAAFVAGVPQLVLPLFASDQFFNAERVEAVGAGLQVPAGLDGIGEVPALLDSLLTQQRFTDGAGRIAADIAALPDVSTTVDVLQELADQRPATMP